MPEQLEGVHGDVELLGGLQSHRSLLRVVQDQNDFGPHVLQVEEELFLLVARVEGCGNASESDNAKEGQDPLEGVWNQKGHRVAWLEMGEGRLGLEEPHGLAEGGVVDPVRHRAWDEEGRRPRVIENLGQIQVHFLQTYVLTFPIDI